MSSLDPAPTNARFLAQPPGLGLGSTKAPSGQGDKSKDVMEIDGTHPDNLTDDLVRDNGVLKDSMEMDDDGAAAGRRAYGTDDLELDDKDGG